MNEDVGSSRSPRGNKSLRSAFEVSTLLLLGGSPRSIIWGAAPLVTPDPPEFTMFLGCRICHDSTSRFALREPLSFLQYFEERFHGLLGWERPHPVVSLPGRLLLGAVSSSDDHSLFFSVNRLVNS